MILTGDDPPTFTRVRAVVLCHKTLGARVVKIRRLDLLFEEPCLRAGYDARLDRVDAAARTARLQEYPVEITQATGVPLGGAAQRQANAESCRKDEGGSPGSASEKIKGNSEF